MKEIIKDANPNNCWSVIYQLGNTFWIHMKRWTQDNLSNHSIIYEYDAYTENMKPMHVLDNDFVLNDLVASDKYIYMAVSIDTNKSVLLRVDRVTNLAEIICEYCECYLLSIEAICNDLYGLMYILIDKDQNVTDRYDLVNIPNKSTETIYVRNQNNMKFFTEKLFLAIKDNKPLVILDRHITPSDKPMANGLADEIVIL